MNEYTLPYRFLNGNVHGCVFAKNRPVSLNWSDYIGVTERGSFKNIRKRCISRSSKAVCNIKLALTYLEFTVHMQNQLKAGSFVETKAGLPHCVQFFSYARAMK